MWHRIRGLFDFTGQRRLDAVFAGRTPLTPGEFFTRYFEKRGYDRDLVLRIRKIFAENISLDLSRLSATDDFSRELQFLWKYDSLADVEIVLDLETEFGITISDVEATRMTTLLAVVEVVDGKLRRGEGTVPGSIPQHPGHHRGTLAGWVVLTVLAALLVFVLPSPMSGLVGLGFLAVVVIRVLMRMGRSRCPRCRIKMTHETSITCDGSNWEVFACPSCRKKWRIPGLSADS